MPVAQAWAGTASASWVSPRVHPWKGEEWLSGPYTVMAHCNSLMATLSQVEDKRHLNHTPLRGCPMASWPPGSSHSIWDHLLLSGVSVDVWMQRKVSAGRI